MDTKKIVLLTIMIIFMCTGFVIANLLLQVEDKEPKSSYKYLKEYDFFKRINIDEVTELEIVKYTVGGDRPTIVTDKEEIINRYNSLGNIKVGKETTKTCEDNTTIYYFISNERETKIEIECDWIIINNKRYLIHKN